MLKDRIKKLLADNKTNIFTEEKEFAVKHQLLSEDKALEVMDPKQRFEDAYIERGDKETEEILSLEKSDFLNQPISYFKKHKNEFMYMESDWFEIIGADAVSFEMDDVFENYEVMLGLRLPKKGESPIREYISAHTHSGSPKYSLMFSQQDGLWEFNFSLNDIQGYGEELTIREAYQLIYEFLFHLVSAVEEERIQ